MATPARDVFSADVLDWRIREATKLLVTYGILIAVLFPAFYFVTRILPGNIPDALSLRLISGGFSLALVLTVLLFPSARRYAQRMQLANVGVFLVLLLAVLVNSGNLNWYVTGIVIGLFGTQYAFLSSRDLILAYIVAFAFQVCYSALLGIFFEWTNLYALGVVLFASIISVASGIVRINTVKSELSARVHLRMQAITDGLTSTLNRNGLNEAIDAALVSAVTTSSNVALIYIDLNDFKTINDTYGHDVGDAALLEATRRIRSLLNESQILARIGGDEFVVLASSDASESTVAALMERICVALEVPFGLDSVPKPLPIRASAGIALYPRDGTTRLELLAFADHQMYAAKRALQRRSTDGS